MYYTSMNFIEQYNEFCMNYLKFMKKISRTLSLTQAQVICIKAIPYDGISQNSLANKLLLDNSTLSRNLEKLKLVKLINKSISRNDKRTAIITLTQSGKKTYQKISDMLQKELNTIIYKIDIKDLDYITEIFNKINWELELQNQKHE